MIIGKRTLAIIPARGGSKGVLRKNIRLVAGRPLIAYTIEAAKRSLYLDCIAVSSEDDEILSIATQCGAHALKRPVLLAQDETPGIAPILHAIEMLPGFDYVVLLQPTSPLRSGADIDACIEHCVQREAPVCVSVSAVDVPPPRIFEMGGDAKLRRFIPGDPPNRRQDIPAYYAANGAIYVANVAWLREHKRFITSDTIGYEMPCERSLDIDTEWDLRFFEFIVAQASTHSANAN